MPTFLNRLLALSRPDSSPTGIRATAALVRRMDKRAIGALTGPLDSLETRVLELALRHFLPLRLRRNRTEERRLVHDIEDMLHLLPAHDASLVRDLLLATEYGPWAFGPRHERLTALDEDEQRAYFIDWSTTPLRARRASYERLRHLVLQTAWYPTEGA